MDQYLIDHAITNAWCNPTQDNQLLLAAHKVTRPLGELNRFKLMNRTISLPTSNKLYHVFQVGQIHPRLVGLLPINPDWTNEVWVNFSDAINNSKLFATIYTANGVTIPRFNVYYMYSNDRDLIFAIELDSNVKINYELDTIYVRLYSNAFYQTNQADAMLDYLYTNGKVVRNTQDILDLQTEYNVYAGKVGHVFAYTNGFLIDKIDLVNVSVGDSVEFIYDSSVKKIDTFKISDLNVFTSILDSKYKYLLMSDDSSSTIDYHDDIDIHLIYQKSPTRYKGYYYHRNAIDSHRMVTHKDYSIVVDYLSYIVNKLSVGLNLLPLDITKYSVQVITRNSGYFRPLVYDDSRIFELYKLSYNNRMQALVGVNSTAEVWKAENLENSGYTKLMRSLYSDINGQLVQDAYGYNAISKILADSPIYTTPVAASQMAKLPYGLTQDSTIYEYDINGVMLGFYSHSNSDEYICTNNNARMVEGIVGTGTDTSDLTFGTDDLTLPLHNNYRVYMCYLVNDIPNDEWVDITDTAMYTVVNGMLVWANLEQNQFLMVRTDKTFLAYDLDLEYVAGNLYFTIAEIENRGTEPLGYSLPVPLGELDIFLNGKELINGLDYIVKFPMVQILNMKYLAQPAMTTTQKVHVRYTGFCNADLSTNGIDDFGFIEHGVLSNNNRYDIRDDKVLNISVDGQVKQRDSLIFSELHDGISVVNGINGQPYQVKDVIVPLRQLTNENTYTLKNKALIIDQAISNYMTVKLPQPDRNAISTIYEKFPLVSPFISRIIDELITGHIPTNLITTTLSDNDILNICNAYEGLLDFDPTSIANQIDNRYISIHPHPLNTVIKLTIYQYRFLLRVVKLYCNDLIELSPFISFSA